MARETLQQLAGAVGLPPPSLDGGGKNASGYWRDVDAVAWQLPLQLYTTGERSAEGLDFALQPQSCDDAVPQPDPAGRTGTIRAWGARRVIDLACEPGPGAIDAGQCFFDRPPPRRVLRVSCLPSLVIIGFQKCATAELQGWLSAHPVLQRWEGNRLHTGGFGEANFFKEAEGDQWVRSRWVSDYLTRGFAFNTPGAAAGVYTFEKSPNYGMMPESKLAMMRGMLPSVRIVTLVRQPRSRAYSGFQHNCRLGKVFQIVTGDGAAPGTPPEKLAAREAVAGRVVIAHDAKAAAAALAVRLGVFAVYERHFRRLAAPCSPASFATFLMLDDGAPRLTAEVVGSIIDLRQTQRPPGERPAVRRNDSTAVTSVLGHGLYADNLRRVQRHFPAEQVRVIVSEEMFADPIAVLDDLQGWLGLPHFSFESIAVRTARGGLAASWQTSKSERRTYDKMLPATAAALDEFYAEPNADLNSMLGGERIARLWS